MRDSARYHVLCHASSVDTQGDNLLATLITHTLHTIPSNMKSNSLSLCRYLNEIGFYLKNC
jgi:hypothetical protein